MKNIDLVLKIIVFSAILFSVYAKAQSTVLDTDFANKLDTNYFRKQTDVQSLLSFKSSTNARVKTAFDYPVTVQINEAELFVPEYVNDVNTLTYGFQSEGNRNGAYANAALVRNKKKQEKYVY